MKKMFMAVIAVCTLLSSMQAQFTHKLVSREFEDYESFQYFYNEKGQVDSAYKSLEGGWKYYVLWEYDENGDCIKENDFQWLDGTYKHTSILEYTYDNNHNLMTRKNYNSFGGTEFTLGGLIKWVYNANGDVLEEITYLASWDNPGEFDLYSVLRNTYENDLLTRYDFYSLPWGETDSNKMTLEGYTTFKYNDQNRLIEKQIYNKNWGSDEIVAGEKVVYTYDEVGNIVKYESWNRTSIQARYVYHYNLDVKRENTMYPINFEDITLPEFQVMTTSPNIVDLEEWWQVPNGADTLFHGGDYIWTYAEMVGNETAKLPVVEYIRFFVNDDVLGFNNLAVGSPVQIFNVAGTMVRDTKYVSGGISLQGLPKGVYFARINHKNVIKFVR